eukprot:1578611-Pyramimonas_sp.AAC.1
MLAESVTFFEWRRCDDAACSEAAAITRLTRVELKSLSVQWSSSSSSSTSSACTAHVVTV